MNWALAIHGGAGGIPSGLPKLEIERIRETMRQALEAGRRILESGGRSVDAVQTAVHVMENSGVLNAGRGPVLNHDGVAELDASIMSGRDRRAGAVAGLRHIANPIDLARLVMEHSSHVFLVGDGAERFAKEQGISLVPSDYFLTPRRIKEWQDAIHTEKVPNGPATTEWNSKGTVGAVALDQHGDLAAATSTGGLTNKHMGRVGDSPIIGAGTYAENGVCAVSATGHGEFFIRYTAAGEVCARVRYGRQSIQVAASGVISELHQVGGDGGMIAMGVNGDVAMPYSTPTMLRGRVRADGAPEVVVEAAKSELK